MSLFFIFIPATIAAAIIESIPHKRKQPRPYRPGDFMRI